jgi:hypothetical protein
MEKPAMSRSILTLRLGSEILWQGESLQTETSSINQSLISDQKTWRDTIRFIYMQVSASGPMGSDVRESLTLRTCGRSQSLANLSARQAKDLDLLTSDISAPIRTISSLSAALQSALASKSRQTTDWAGSTLFNLTWKERVTPAGRKIPALRASVRRTSGNGSESPTLPKSGWPTPQSRDGSHGGGSPARAMGETRHGSNLDDFAILASWVTPSARDWKDSAGMATTGINPDGSERTRLDMLPRQATLTSWPTPRSLDGENGAMTLQGAENEAIRKGWNNDLGTTAFAAGPARLTVSGALAIGSTAEMASGGQLSPAHSRWLMALPPVWDDCAPMVTRSTRKSRLISADPSAKS